MCAGLPEAGIYAGLKAMGDKASSTLMYVVDPISNAVAAVGEKIAQKADGGEGGIAGSIHGFLTPMFGQAAIARERGTNVANATAMGLAQDLIKGAAVMSGGALSPASGSVAVGTTSAEATGAATAAEAAATTNSVMASELAGMGYATGPVGVTANGTAAATTATTGAGLTGAEKIALGVGLLSAAATGISQGVSAKEEAKALERQASADETKANMEEEAAQREAIDAARKAKQERGTGIAQMAANGVMVDDAREGSVPSVYQSDLAAELAYDQSKIMENAQLRAWGYRSNADELRRSARTRRRAGYVSTALGAFNAGVSAYGGTKTLLS